MSVTMNDIAIRAGTSVAAVSVVLNGAKSKTLRMSDETRHRIVSAAMELGYRRNPLAGALATGRSHVIGVMLPRSDSFSDHDPFFSMVTMGVTSGAALRGYNVMLYSATAEDEGPRAASMIDRKIDGLVLVSPPTLTPIYDECRRLGIPVVSVMGSPIGTTLSVDSDDREGGRLATRHLVALGHSRIAHLTGRAGIVTSAPRFEGYKQELQSAGIPFDPCIVATGEFNREVGYQSTAKLLRLSSQSRPTAIFAANDLSAHGAIEAIQDAGFDVPGDIAVVGYDDTWYATIPKPALTTVKVDVAGLGRSASELLISCLSCNGGGDERVVRSVSLVIRDSCGSVGYVEPTPLS